MQEMRKFLLYLLFIFILFGCTDELEGIAPGSDLTGVWSWTNTVGGLAAHIHETPETTGNTVQLVLNKDLTYEVLENNVEVSSGEYSLTKEESIYSNELENYITLVDNFYLQNVVLNGIVSVEDGSVLTISDNAYDGIGSRFTKEN